jgi:hypothetical protein
MAGVFWAFRKSVQCFARGFFPQPLPHRMGIVKQHGGADIARVQTGSFWRSSYRSTPRTWASVHAEHGRGRQWFSNVIGPESVRKEPSPCPKSSKKLSSLCRAQLGVLGAGLDVMRIGGLLCRVGRNVRRMQINQNLRQPIAGAVRRLDDRRGRRQFKLLKPRQYLPAARRS